MRMIIILLICLKKYTYFTIRNSENLRVWTRYGQTENERWVKWMTAFSWTKLHILHTTWREKAQHMNLWHRIAKRTRNCCSQQSYLVDYYVEEERERMVKQSIY